MVGIENLPAVNRAALTGIAVTGIMRYVLFLAILGVVVASGVVIDTSGQAANPAAQAFRSAAGDLGFRLFGIIFWAALPSQRHRRGVYLRLVPARVQADGDGMRFPQHGATVIFIAVSLVRYLLITTPPAAMLVFRRRPERSYPAHRSGDLPACRWKREDLMAAIAILRAFARVMSDMRIDVA